MFTWINKQRVQSSRGFVVQFTGRFTAEYHEGGKRMTIDVESGLTDDNKQGIIIGTGAFRHWDNEGANLPAEEQAQLLQNFREAMEFQGLVLLIQ